MALDQNQYPIPQPEVKKSVSPVKANDTAYYTASLVSPEQMENTFDTVYNELMNEGDSLVHQQAVDKFKQEQDATSKQVITDVIQDPNVDKAYKRQVLQNYVSGDYISSDIRQKYIKNVATLDNAHNDMEAQAQDEIVDTASNLSKVVNQDRQNEIFDYAFKTSRTSEEQEARDKARESLAKRGFGKLAPTKEEQEDSVKSVLAEGVSVIKFMEDTMAGLIEDGFTAAEASNQRYEAQRAAQAFGLAPDTDVVDWANINEDKYKDLNSVQQELKNFVDHVQSDESLNKSLADAMGLSQEEMDDTGINKAIAWLGNKIVAGGDYLIEKGVVDSQEEFMGKVADYGFAALLFGGAATIGTKALKGKGKTEPTYTKESQYIEKLEAYKTAPTRKNSPKNVTEKANPKVANELNTANLLDKSNKGTDASGTSKVEIIESNVLPVIQTKIVKRVRNGKEEVVVTKLPEEKVEVKPDINSNIEKHLPKEQAIAYQDSVVLNSMFDDNLVVREARLADLDRRLQVIEETQLHHHQPASTLNMTGDRLDGTMRFTPNANYAFTTKKSVVDAGTKLQEVIDDLKVQEIKADVDSGLGTIEQVAKQHKQSRVRVRELKSGETMSLDKFKKMNLKKGQYILEFDFDKKYDLLSNEMLGTPLANQSASLWLPTTASMDKVISNSVIGDYFFSTGTGARWMEKARADLAPRAAVIANKVVEDFTKIVAKHKKLNPVIADTIRLQETLKMDVVPSAMIARNFPDLNTQQLAVVQEAQIAWRKANDHLYEITNIGEKQRLQTAGFNHGYYVNDEFKGAVKPIGKNEFKKINKETEVYDPVADEFVKYDRDSMKLMKMEGNMIGKTRKNNTESDYVIVGQNAVHRLPNRVVNKLPGHSFKAYKSNFYIEAIPKKLKRNGKDVDEGTIRHDHKETRGTANTKAEAIALIREMKDPNSKKYIGDDYDLIDTPRNAGLDDINDHAFEYRVQEDLYRNSLKRVDEMQTLDGATVLTDPLKALNEAANRIARTGTASQFHKAFTDSFMRDFKRVLDHDSKGLPKFPDSIEQINAIGKKGDRVELEALVQDARAVYRRHMAFQRGGTMSGIDRWTQSNLHALAGILEDAGQFVPGAKVSSQAIGSWVRKQGNKGLVGLTKEAKKAATLLYITYQMPVKHWIIQPMMYLEQSIIHPKSFAGTLHRTPSITNILLNGTDLLKNTKQNFLGVKMSKKQRALLNDEVEVLRREGVLESIDQHLAAVETVRGHVPKINKPANIGESILRGADNAFEATKGAFNKAGFTRGELANRVGLWLQTKARWLDDPKNAGKDWRDPRNAKEISFEAWRQSGAMTSSGALRFQQTAGLGFLTQFMAISVKSMMNTLQNNATNLSRTQRAAITANRVLMHGLEYGLPMYMGKHLLDYLSSSDDPEVVEAAEFATRGYIDRSFNMLLESASGEPMDLTISQSASLGSLNSIGDTVSSMFNIARYMTGDRDAEQLNIASVKALGTAYERVSDAMQRFVYQPFNAATVLDATRDLVSMTSFGNNANKALIGYSLNQVVTSGGTKTGLEMNGFEAFAQTMGFKQRAEYDQYIQKELSRDIDDRVNDQIKDFDETMMKLLKDDPDNVEKYLEIFQKQHSILQEAGVFNDIEIDRILNGIITKQASRFKNNETDNMIKWLLRQDQNDEDTQAFIRKFKNHPDPTVQELVEMFENKPGKNIYGEIE